MVRAMKAGYNERGLPRVVATATDSHFVGAIVRIEWYCNKHFALRFFTNKWWGHCSCFSIRKPHQHRLTYTTRWPEKCKLCRYGGDERCLYYLPWIVLIQLKEMDLYSIELERTLLFMFQYFSILFANLLILRFNFFDSPFWFDSGFLQMFSSPYLLQKASIGWFSFLINQFSLRVFWWHL